MTLEVIIAPKGSLNGVYVAFPISRKNLWRKLKSVGASRDNWEIKPVKTGSEKFGDAVMLCNNLDELSYMGHCINNFNSEDEYYFFFELCESGCAEGQYIDSFITLALNLKNYFRLDGISNAKKLGRYVVKQNFKKSGDDTPEVLATYSKDFLNIGYSTARKYRGKFSNGHFYGCLPSSLRYNGEESEIPAYALIDSLPL